MIRIKPRYVCKKAYAILILLLSYLARQWTRSLETLFMYNTSERFFIHC